MYMESTRGKIRREDFLAWLIGGFGFRKEEPYGDFEFHWPTLLVSLFFGVGGIWAHIYNYNMLRENIDEIINVEIVREASKVIDDLRSSDDNVSIESKASKFKKDLKNLIKECKNDIKMGKDPHIKTYITNVRQASERTLRNLHDKEALKDLVESINALISRCVDKKKVDEFAKRANK